MSDQSKSDYEVTARYGAGAVKIAKSRHVKTGYTSFAVEKLYKQNRQWKTTGFLRSVSELEELLLALEDALEAEGGTVALVSDDATKTPPF